MQTRPADISDTQLLTLLEGAWGFHPTALTYHPHGFGSHHWIARSADDEQRFLTVDQLDRALVGGPRAADILNRAFETAYALRHSAGCDFVVAPERSRNGRILELLGDRYSLAVFPFVVGIASDFSHGSIGRRPAVIDLLVELHSATSRVSSTLPGRDDLSVLGETELRLALHTLDRPWPGGPYSEPARSALRTRAASVRRALDHHRRLATRVRHDGWVITHGEPHAGNIMHTLNGLRLIDWDMVLVAPPERDLAVMKPVDAAGLERYERATGRRVDAAAFELYAIGWDLKDVAEYLRLFRRPHVASEDTEKSWRGLNYSLQLNEHWPDLGKRV